MVWGGQGSRALRSLGRAYGICRIAPPGSPLLGKGLSSTHLAHNVKGARRISSRACKVFAAAGSKKKDVVFECSECGHQALRDGGQCPSCGEWGSLQRRERTAAGAGGGAGVRAFMEFENESGPSESKSNPSQYARGGWISSSGTAKSLKTIKEQQSTHSSRISFSGLTGMEVSRVLGGGLVTGSLVLVGGDPGIGKSTLLLQVAGMMAESEGGSSQAAAKSILAPDIAQGSALRNVLYISAEESAEQIYHRAVRLGLDGLDNLSILTETRLDTIIKEISNLQPAGVILDSIQAVYLSDANGSAGSLTQIRECCTALVHVAKGSGIPIFIVGHVTKDGNLAGPKALEHIVDVVLYMEGERHQFYRILRGLKNRFGATDEIGVFEMDNKGMHAVVNPSAMFLRDRGADPQGVGSSVAVTVNGTRPLLLEVQALCTSVSSQQKEARLYNVGVDGQRLLLVRGILEKYVKLKMYSVNLHVNVVGGLLLKDPAGDLAVVVAIASAYLDQPVASDIAFVGEVGLGGELRAVVHLEKRLSEVGKLGFRRCIIPKLSRERPLPSLEKLEVVQCATIAEALVEVIGAGPLQRAAQSRRRKRRSSGRSEDGGSDLDDFDSED